jgi:hypothetical protein
MTAPKEGGKRRIIVDLSFPSPQNHAVNLSVSKNSYAGTPFTLKLPTTDTICQVLNTVGKNIKIFKVDLARAFRQLYIDPFDIKYLGLQWRGQFYVDISVPFGYRNGTLACLAPESVTDAHFNSTIQLLKSLGFSLSDSKTVAQLLLLPV